jgi:OOP family OmpA-OmpF porin
MLTAIRDFVQDSFSVQKGDSLDTLQFGELTLWVEQGSQAILAGVIQGNAPQKLRLVFQDTLARIHVEQSRALDAFDGDITPFAATKQELEACLQAHYEVKKQKPSPLVWIVLGAAGISLLTWVGLFIRDNLRWIGYLEKLNAEPGIVITKIEKHGDKYFVSGLRDPLAADPTRLLQAAHVNPKTVMTQWEPYISLHPDLLAARAKQLLQAPDTVSLKADKNGALYATGSAPHQWIVESRKRVQFIPGITKFQENLTDADLRQLELSQKQIEKQIIRFAKGTTQLKPGQDDTLAKLVREIEKLSDFALSLNKDVRIKIVGHTDERGLENTNMILSQARADAILSTLVSKGFDPTNLEAVGVGSTEPLKNEFGVQESEINRSVSFKVTITDKPNSSTLKR